MKRSNRSKHLRQQTGQLEMFAGELVVATMVVIGFLFFLLNSGTASYYKEKLGFISEQGAQYAANYGGKKVQAATTAFVTDQCKKTGLNVTNLKVQVTPSTISGKSAFSCQVSGTFPLPFFQNGVFPGTVTSSDTAVAVAMTSSSGSSGPSLNILGIGNVIINTNGMIPTGNVLGIGNVFTNQATIGNTLGIGNVNSTGNTIGIGNVNSTGNTIGIGNVGNSGNTLGIGSVGNSGNSTGIGSVGNSGNSLGIGGVGNEGNFFGIAP